MLTQLESEYSAWKQAQLTPHAPVMESPTSAGLTRSQVWSFSRRLKTSAIARQASSTLPTVDSFPVISLEYQHC